MASHPHFKPKSIFVAGFFLGSLMWVTLAGAQTGTGESAPTAPQQEPAVQTFAVAPVQRGTAILMPNAQTPEPPAPLDVKTKTEILQSLGGSGDRPKPGKLKEQSEPVLEYLLLSAKQPFFNQQGFLTLTLPHTVHPETAINFNRDFPGSAGVKLKVEKGRTYLLDFAVKSRESGTYLLETESGRHEFADQAASQEHVLAALQATASGWTTVRLKRNGTGFHLYYVEVTRVN